MLHFKEVPLIKKSHLDRTVGGELLDCLGTKRANPVNTIDIMQCIDLFLGQHPSVANHHKLLDTKRIPHFLNLWHKRLRVASVAFIDRHCYGYALSIREQSIVDLKLTLLPIAVVSHSSKRACLAFK